MSELPGGDMDVAGTILVLIGIAATVAGVWILAGVGWAFIAGGCQSVALGLLVTRG